MLEIYFTAIVMIISSICFAQKSSEAKQLAEQGKFKMAIEKYNSILSSTPSDADALLGRAFAYSWNHQYKMAIGDFDAYLLIRSNDITAMNGLGYTYGWSGKYVAARDEFSKVLQRSPGNIEAEKGMAYIALWSGKSNDAINRFDKLLQTDRKTEYSIAKAYAYIQKGELKGARQLLQQVLQNDPNNKEAKKILGSIQLQAAFVEADAIAGLTSISGKSKTSMRLVQVSVRFVQKLKLLAKYDNSLSQDNLTLINRDISAPYIGGAILYDWSKSATTKLEYGTRNIDRINKATQYRENQLSGEQIFYCKHMSFNVGGSIFRHADSTVGGLVYGGFHQSLGTLFTGGVQFFHSKRELYDSKENRLLLTGDFNLPKGLQLTGGVYFGRVNSDIAAFSGPVNGGFVKAYLPVTNIISVHLMTGGEHNYAQNLFTAQAGVRIRLEK